MKLIYTKLRKLIITFFCLPAALLLMQCNPKLTYRTTTHQHLGPIHPTHSVVLHKQVADTIITTQPVDEIINIVMESPINDNVVLDSLSLTGGYKWFKGLLPYSTKSNKLTIQFYAGNHYKTKWLGTYQPTPLYYALLQMIRDSERLGLNPQTYKTEQFSDAVQKLYQGKYDNIQIGTTDAQLTYLFFYFVGHVCEGRINYRGDGDKIWRTYSPTEIDIAILQDVHSPEELHTRLNNVHPPYEQYAKLQSLLIKYRSLNEQYPPENNFIPIRLSSTLNPDDSSQWVPVIRHRLNILGYAVKGITNDTLVYTDAMASAVKWFQLHHGLEIDGRIGKETLHWLNLSFQKRAELVALNMERLRWLPPLSDQCIVINVPEYQLRLYRQNKVDLTMKVIVGNERTATPIFSDTLRYIVFSPEWGVPQSIIRKEIIEHLKKNSNYYAGKGYTFYKQGQPIDPAIEDWSNPAINPAQFRVVQQPGPKNSLGLVKFIMPNNMSIYLHDTPTDYLFDRDQRAFSHGCIRVSEPAALAKALLCDKPHCTEDFIREKMNQDSPYTVHLNTPTQVVIMYLTTWIDDNGFINFRKDLYGHDQRQLTMLSQASNSI